MMYNTYLGCHEFWSAAERTRGAAMPHILFAKTVVSDLDMPIQGQQDIVELEITVKHMSFV